MALFDIAELADDQDFSRRVTACYSVETLSSPDRQAPEVWAAENRWAMASQPGFGDAYAYAFNSKPPVTRPGQNPAVITDNQITAAVQSLL